MRTAGTDRRKQSRVKRRKGNFQDYLTIADALLLQPGWRFRIRSDSMEPALRIGDRVDLEAVAFEQIRSGDLVTICVGPALVCHRAVRTYVDAWGEWWLVTRGDRSAMDDQPVRARQIVGRVTRVARSAGLTGLFWRCRVGAGKLASSFRRGRCS